MPSERELREQICEVGRLLYERGHNAPGDGNVSVRLSPRYLLATPTMKHKGRLRADEIVKVSAEDGRPVDAAQRGSSELRMHLAIYADRSDVNAIVHAHSPHTVGLSVAGVSMEQPVVPEAILALGSVPTVPYASPTTTDVPTAVRRFLPHCQAFILERHGPVALGATLAEALSRLEIVEHTAKITSIALAAGGAKPLPEDEANKLRQMAIDAGLLPRGYAPATTQPENALVDAIAAQVVERLRSRGLA